MPIYEFHCDNCKTTREIYSSMREKHWAFCSKCKKEMRRVFGNMTFNVKGYSPGNSLKQDAIDQKIHKALTDESPVTKTMQEIGAEQAIRRAERRGEDTNKALHKM